MTHEWPSVDAATYITTRLLYNVMIMKRLVDYGELYNSRLPPFLLFQEKIEPPVYVSDRRLVKAIQLLQVAAFCNGRDSVSEYDVLLMQV